MTPNPITLTTYQHQNIHLLIASKQNDNGAKLLTIAHIEHGETGSSQPNNLSDSESVRKWLNSITIHNASVKKRLLDAKANYLFIEPTRLTNTSKENTNEFAKNSLSEENHTLVVNLLRTATEQLASYFAGKRQTFDLPLDISHGTEFQQQVWQNLQDIDYGQTITYAELAERVGNAKAVRAVANANGKNAFSIAIPCHRVIASDGGLGGYTGGIDKKQTLLKLEQTTPEPSAKTHEPISLNSEQEQTNLCRIHVVLVQPDIPANTGNIIRLCANTGAKLHLVKPLGFELDDKKLRRAGLDYREYADLKVHDDWQSAKNSLSNNNCRVMVGLTTKLSQPFYDYSFIKQVLSHGGDISEGNVSNIALVFGSETAGLPEAVRADIGEENWLRLPMLPNSRSLNLSNSVAICLYEVWRQLGFIGDEGKSEGYDVPNHVMQNAGTK